MNWIFVAIIASIPAANGQVFLPWQKWSECSAFCGTGIQYRTRSCRMRFEHTPRCVGKFTQKKPCKAARECGPGDPIWAEWYPWSDCSSTTCKAGIRKRYRRCTLYSKFNCEQRQSEFCYNHTSCGKDENNKPQEKESDLVISYDEWGQWSHCSVTCGRGSMHRIRKCTTVPGIIDCKKTGIRLCDMHKCDANQLFSSDRQVLQWGPWSECTTTCGGGRAKRTVNCDGKSCAGTQEKSCNNFQCKPKPKTTFNLRIFQWGSWSECSSTCGLSERMRSRKCADVPCAKTQRKACKYIPCSNTRNVNLRTLQWGPWSGCTVTCGGGRRIRTRKCDNKSCAKSQRKSCNIFPCKAKSIWSQWSTWSLCSETCGDGFKVRVRSCTNVNQCPGNDVEKSDCRIKECESEWSPWSRWSECSRSCGSGNRRRVRTCVSGENCSGNKQDRKVCKLKECKQEWSPWGRWSECSRSCGYGIRKRGRTCVFGENCPGNKQDRKVCKLKECKQGWSTWSSWSECSVTCGEGNKTRRRTCIDDAGCNGNNKEKGSCELEQCTQEWSPWSRWSECSRSCGYGIRKRGRMCVYGDNCPGNKQDRKVCKLTECKQGWSTWSSWSECSVTCGEGNKTRERTCIDDVGCNGKNKERDSCELEQCIQEWSPWSRWSECSTSCGSGIQLRERMCLSDVLCPENKQEKRACKSKECQKENWSDWSIWSKCYGSCGKSGWSVRKRLCAGGTAGMGSCIGKPSENNKCRKICTPESWNSWGEWSECSKSCESGVRKRKRTCHGGVEACQGNNESESRCNVHKCMDKNNVPM